MRNKCFLLLASVFFFSLCSSNSGDGSSGKNTFDVPETVTLYGNTYITKSAADSPQITNKGISGWSDPNTVLSVYFRTGKTGKLNIALYGKADREAKIKAGVAGKTFEITVDNRKNDIIKIGEVNITEPGYVRIDLQGVSSGGTFGEYTALMIGGTAAEGGIVSVPETPAGDNWPYWGRRGPSVHMSYTKPAQDIRWFYNEVTVPVNNDVLHSYFMSNGFSGGYMGMQVNSNDINERRILFSVWSTYTTDNPAEIPEEYRVATLRQGEGVTIKEFGNEGSGGQSYLLYPWEAGKTYKFLTEVVPDGNEKTIFTGYFCGHDGRWRLIASFIQPSPGKQSETHYTRMHSFLENFNPAMGYVTREVYFDNQWAVTTGGEWIELCEGTFTCDDTGAKKIRLDYAGGIKDNRFYLKNCGFFNETVTPHTKFTRPAKGTPPDIDLEALAGIPSIR